MSGSLKRKQFDTIDRSIHFLNALRSPYISFDSRRALLRFWADLAAVHAADFHFRKAGRELNLSRAERLW